MRNYAMNPKYKDNLFRMLFSEKRELLSLYNAVRGTCYTNIDDLEVNTLDGVIYLSLRNDISFIIGGELLLYEHQSTWCGNMPLRSLMYIADLYAGETEDENLYVHKVREYSKVMSIQEAVEKAIDEIRKIYEVIEKRGVECSVEEIMEELC